MSAISVLSVELRAEVGEAVRWERLGRIVLDLDHVRTQAVGANLDSDWMVGVEDVHDDVVLRLRDDRRRDVERGLETQLERVGRGERGIAPHVRERDGKRALACRGGVRV